MQFVDQATINVYAGNGGHGSLSFRREKYAPMGGPDGGNGGAGGDVYLQATNHLNTLIDFRYQRRLRAERGGDGSGRSRSGRRGADLIIAVPIGTSVYATATDELMADLTQHGQTALVAKGGRFGMGNEYYKSSTNRSPRKTTKGQAGEERELRLELKLLADVGLLGLPNAGKSTLIRACSSAKPKVADYPFTTLKPQLGVVRVDAGKSFVMADIPGLIPGAASGLGLGIRFLKHLSRTATLLHMVDIASHDTLEPDQQIADIAQSIHELSHELAAYDHALLAKPRWLVFNKIDCMPPATAQAISQGVVERLHWKDPHYLISGSSGQGVQQLCHDLMGYITTSKAKIEPKQPALDIYQA